MSDAPSTSWAFWAWQAYKDGRLVDAPAPALPAVQPGKEVMPDATRKVCDHDTAPASTDDAGGGAEPTAVQPAHVNETPKGEHDARDVLTPATERSATMTDELVERLRDEAQDLHGMAWRNTYGGQETTMSATLASEAADRIEALTADRENRLADLRIIKAERDRLREAAITLRDDMMERAQFRMDTISGEQYRIVNAESSSWTGFCAALKGESHE